MLQRRGQPSVDEISRWLEYISQNLHYPQSRLGYNHWQLIITTNPIAKTYPLDIKDHGEWVSYGTSLGHDVTGPGRVVFYKYLLNLNAQLNSVHIGIEDGRVVLTGEYRKENLDFRSFAHNIALIDNAFQVTYPLVLEEIKRLGLRFNK